MGRSPDFKGDGIAVWTNQDKNGDAHLDVVLFGGQIIIKAWKNKPKEVEEDAAN